MGLTGKSRNRRRPGETRTRDRLSRYRRRSTRPWWYACRPCQPPAARLAAPAVDLPIRPVSKSRFRVSAKPSRSLPEIACW